MYYWNTPFNTESDANPFRENLCRTHSKAGGEVYRPPQKIISVTDHIKLCDIFQ